MEIEGQTVFVTGASRGIGAAIARAFASAGANRIYAAMRNPTETGDPRIVPVRLDITDPAQVQRAATEHGDVSIVVNNAGVLTRSALIGSPDASGAETEMRTNYFGTLAMCRAFAPVLARHGGGAIVNMLSILAHMPMPAVGSYAASKAAALSLTRAIRAELAPQNTRVVAVMPAFVDTAMAAGVTMPKLSPSAVADAIVDAIRRDIEDVYPGPAAEIADAIRRDPKAIERSFAAMLVAGDPGALP